ncbi:hypothetical protein B0T21DRAFT_296090 [Apiosordaria backusii]|uniref:Uncharacterized protein n=1 Tax=Apiosordaria backusii TaxID=314023 RepID=A0AA40AIW1_9PEZI|nr:hypothetical protein B0T21DRAFT_296090 [Apiosordaria backusii]
MVSFTITLCGKSVECSGDTYVDDDKVTDPDIAGIGILLSFIVPAVAAIIAFTLAWIKRRVPQQQYNHVDEMALSWLKRSRMRHGAPSTPAPEISGYQTFILSVNDQMLLTGLGLIIAIYSQICSISMFSFHVACNLAYLCTTVHLATLTVLRLPLKESTKAQRISRVSLMIMGLVGILVSKLLQYSTWEYESNALAACDINWPRTSPNYEYLWDWFCLVLVLSTNYYQSIVTDVAPYGSNSDSEPNPKPVSSFVLAALKKLHRHPGSQGDIASSLDERQDKIEASRTKRLTSLVTTINKRRANSIPRARLLRSVFANIGFDVLFELQNSLVYDLFLCIFWFALAITDLANSLEHGGTDIRPLLEWKFGQVLPVILLLSYALTALGIQASSPNPKETAAAGGDQSLGKAVKRNSQSAVDSDSEVDLGTSPGIAMRSLSNTGFSSQNEDPKSRPTRRVNTVELERAIVPWANKKQRKSKQKPLLNIKDHDAQPIDLIAFARREARGYINAVAIVAFILMVGSLVQMYFYFTETVTALTGCYILLFVYRVVRRSLDIRRIRTERLERERAMVYGLSSQTLVGSSSRNSGSAAGGSSGNEAPGREGTEPRSTYLHSGSLYI